MPKQTYVINNFNGGINNDADPRDIANNQFAELQNIAVDEMGKLIVLGDMGTAYKSLTGALTGAGKGLFAVSTDHDGLLDGNIATPGQTYYLVEDGDTIRGFSEHDDESGTIACTIGSAGPTMYYVDGALRIADADHGGGSTPVWRGYTPVKDYGSSITNCHADISAQWSTQNTEIAGAFATYQNASNGIDLCKNALIGNKVEIAGGGDFYNFDNGTVQTHDATYNGGASTSDSSGHRWGFAIEMGEDSSGSGQWMPTTSTRYKFYVTTMYDEHTQESLPQLMQHWGSDLLHDGGGTATYVGDTVQNEMQFTNANDHNETGEMVAVWFAPVIKLNSVNTNNYNFGAADLDGDGATSASDKGNPRISGLRVDWASNEDGFSTLWQLFDVDFQKGVSCIGVDGGGGGTTNFAPFKAVYTNHLTVDLGTLESNKWTIPPRFIQYDSINGHAPTDTITVDSYKAAVVANRRVYIGNIEQDGIIRGDRMIKSPVNQFDKFPSKNNIDVAIHDGDDIIALLEYADRILQFKRNTCYIINISGSSEYLEGEHKYKGITNPGAACRTDYGIAWANRNGCYLYNGQQVSNLLEAEGKRKINQSTWYDFISNEDYHRIGFNPFKRQLIVLNGTDDANVSNDAYVYDMVTQSWTFSSAMVDDGNSNSNFINDPVDGSLLIFDDGNNTIDKWTDSPLVDTTPPIVIATKDLDFGEPSRRKKLYKIYVTYQGGGAAVIAKYRVNGGTTDYQFNSDNTPFSDPGAVWTTLELKPTTAAEANNKYSYQLRLTGDADTDFMINDITFVYRMKNVK